MPATNRTDETWKSIPGHAGRYEVSDQGRVRSLRRRIYTKSGASYMREGTLLRPSCREDGHLQVYVGGHTAKVHRLVLEAFVGPCPEGMECLHFNDVPDDNRLSNLRWGTRSENKHDSVRNRVHNQVKKTHCPRGHELAGLNLVPYFERRGRRQCRSCARARSYLCKHPEMKERFVQIADSYYESLGKGTPSVSA